VAHNGNVRVEEVLVADPELVGAMGRLVPQLSTTSAVPEAYDLEDIVRAPATALFVARDAESRIVGSLTLATFRVPTGVRAWLDDVGVDEAARGSGAGEALVRAAIERAREAGARTVELTSRPSREAANRLYQRMGFAERETNLYRFSFES